MKANLTRSPWRRRPSLFLGFRAPSAAADSHAVTAPVLPVRRSSTSAWTSSSIDLGLLYPAPRGGPAQPQFLRNHADTLATIVHQPHRLGLVLSRKRPPLAPPVFLHHPLLLHFRASRGVHTTGASPLGIRLKQ